MNNIPEEHQLICEGCGQILDMRDISIVSHGWIEDGEIVCYINNKRLTYSSSKKVGESILWTKDKNQINLN